MAAERLTDQELANAERSIAWTGDPASRLDAAKRAIAELREARTLLTRLEWAGVEDAPKHERVCPICLVADYPHGSNCRLAIAIGSERA